MVRRFPAKLALLLLPFALYLAFPWGVLWLSGEMFECADVTAVAKRQIAGEPVLFGSAFRNATRAFKLENVRLRQPEVVALGSSRVMAFRSEFFKAPAMFYNAGGAAGDSRDLPAFLDDLDVAAAPRLIVVGLDQWWFFGEDQGPAVSPHGGRHYTGLDPLELLQADWLAVYKDWAAEKFRLADLTRDRFDGYVPVGLAAKAEGRGFRPDGSYWYGPGVDDAAAGADFTRELREVRQGNPKFCQTGPVSAACLALVDRFLTDCAARGIAVVAFLPPYAHAVHMAMDARCGPQADQALAASLGRIFAAHGATLVDCGDAGELPGSSDAEMVDGFHGSERTYLRLLLRLAEAAPGLAAFVDAPQLHRLLAQSAGRETFPRTRPGAASSGLARTNAVEPSPTDRFPSTNFD